MLIVNQIAIGLIASAIAITGGVITTKSNKLDEGQFRFYNISGEVDSINPANFVYQDNSSTLCFIDPVEECSAVWTVELPEDILAPEPGQKPNDFDSFEYEGFTQLGIPDK